MKNIFPLIIGLLIGGAFIYVIYRFLPLGMAIAITGGCLATLQFDEEKFIRFIASIGGWVYVGGVIYSFIKNGWITGIISIVIGIVAYSYAKNREK